MSSANTMNGFYNLPSQAAGTAGSIIIYTVPASGTFGSGLPSPTLPAGSGLTVSLTPDQANGWSDVHLFRVRACGKINTTGAASTVALSLYEVPFAQVGQISTTGSVTSTGVAGSSCVLLDTRTAIGSSNVATVEFSYEWKLMFNASAGSLAGFLEDGFTNFTSTPVTTTPTTLSVGTPIASGLVFNGLNFELGFNFSASTAPNAVQVTEFSIDRV